MNDESAMKNESGLNDNEASLPKAPDSEKDNGTKTAQDARNLTTVCYLEQNGCYLMIHRTKKEHDTNKDKLIGLGGHFHYGESPEECMLREMKEECGIVLTDMKLRGIITFVSDVFGCEYMFLFSATEYEGAVAPDCNEGSLVWIKKEELLKCSNLWTGDRIFLKLLDERSEFFSLKLCYKGEELTDAILDGARLHYPEQPELGKNA